MRTRLLSFLMVLLLLCGAAAQGAARSGGPQDPAPQDPGQYQDPNQGQNPDQDQNPDQGVYQNFSPDQLDNLLSPIALYPDPLLAQVLAGAEVVIEQDARPVAVLRPVHSARPGSLLSESIALAEAHGSTVTLDGGFGRDLEEIVSSHCEPLNPPAWE